MKKDYTSYMVIPSKESRLKTILIVDFLFPALAAIEITGYFLLGT